MLYLFTLGRTIDLCLAELQALLKINKIGYKILHQIENHIVVDTNVEIDTDSLMRQSGGIVKIGRLHCSIAQLSDCWENKNCLSNEVMEQLDNSVYHNFGVSIIGFKENIKEICEQIKQELGFHYTLPKDGQELSSAQIQNKKMLEITIVKADKKYFVFHTLVVQDINFWVKKDEGRVFIDDRRGMLPLKAARMMVNISLSFLSFPRKRESIRILDPFCGMGSILQEAIDAGFKNLIGGDINAGVLQKCEKNLEWFKKTFNYQETNVRLIKTDAANISHLIKNPVDLIVSEPFLGDPQKIQRIQKPEEAKNIIKGLEKMYLGCLKDWKNILTPQSTACIIVPEICAGKRVFTIPFIEICGKLGYNIVSGPYEYAREKAVVRRKIYLLKNG